MTRSLRWRLQGWYAVVLLAVVGGFATLLYAQVRSSRFQEIDAALTADALYLDTNLRRIPMFDPEGPRPPDRPPRDRPPPDQPPRERRLDEFRDGPPEHFRPDRPGPPPPGGRPNPERRLAELGLPRRNDADGEHRGAEYFAVWRADGTLMKGAGLPVGVGPPVPERAPPGTVRLRWRGDVREAMAFAPMGARILVGRSVGREQAELNRFAWQLGAAGVAVLAVGLAGGWLASARILRPIKSISDTASAISATNLCERIDPATVDRELEGLARILNATFDRLEGPFERQARFTADASHELRTPLAVLRSQAQLALSRPRSSEDYRKAIEECLRATERMTALVEGLLTLARADAGKLDLRREPVDLKRVTADAIAQLRPLAEGLGIDLVAKLVTAEVRGDRDRLGQVVCNLVTNAVRYNRPGGQVHVHLQTLNGEAVLKVEDTGYGIPEADRLHVFERFYRVDKDRSRQSGGTGLGLAICKSFVEGHGGTISLTSEIDRGTTFEVRLPACTS